MAGPVLGAVLKLDTKAFEDPLKRGSQNVREFAKQMKAAAEVIKQTATAEERFAAGRKRLIGLHQQGLLSTRQYTSAIAQLRTELGVLSTTQLANARAARQQEQAMRRAALAQREFNAVSRIRNNAAIQARGAAASRRNNFLFGAGNVGGIAAGLGVSPLFLGTAGAGLAAGYGIGKSIGAAARDEQSRVAFESLLGNKGKAQTLRDQISAFARVTPFNRTDIEGASKSLLAYGISQDKVIETTRRLGQISAGLGLSLQDLTVLYGESAVAGRVYTKDLRQFTARGIDILTPLSKQFGVAKDAVYELAEAGELSFKNLDDAIKQLTGPGGRFEKGLVEQSKTLLGVWNNLTDAVELFSINVGNSALPSVKSLVSSFENLIPGASLQRDIALSSEALTTAGVKGRTFSERRSQIALIKEQMAAVESTLKYGVQYTQARLDKAGGRDPGVAYKLHAQQLENLKTALKQEEAGLETAKLWSKIAPHFQTPRLQQYFEQQAAATAFSRQREALRGALRRPDTIDLPDHPEFRWRRFGRRLEDGTRVGLRFNNDIPETQLPAAITRGSGAAASAIAAAHTVQSRSLEISQQQLATQKTMEQHLANIAAAAFQGNVFGAGVPTVEFR